MDRTDSVDIEERLAWLKLKLIPELGNRSILRLIRHFGTPRAVLEASAQELSEVPGLRERARRAVEEKRTARSPEEEWETLCKEGVKILSMHDVEYPANLAAIPDPPVVLFVKGSLEPRDLVAVAVVGSRAASPTGLIFTEQLCLDLA